MCRVSGRWINPKREKLYTLEGVNFDTVNKTKAILDPNQDYKMLKRLCKLHLRFGLMWLMGIVTGLRISDLLRLRPQNIKQITWVREGKTGRIRGLFIPDDVLQAVDFCVTECNISQSEYLFFSSATRRYKPISRQWAHRIIAREAQILDLKHIGAHSMRKIYACNLYRSTGKIEAVQTALGHKDISTTFFYIRDVFEK